MSPSRFALPFGTPAGGWRPLTADESGSSGAGDDGAAGGADDEEGEDGEWGLGKHLELFEVSAKDGAGKPSPKPH